MKYEAPMIVERRTVAGLLVDNQISSDQILRF